MPLALSRRDACVAAATAAVLGIGTLATALDGAPRQTPHASAHQVVTRHVVARAAVMPTTTATSTVDPTLQAAVRERLRGATASGFSAVVDIAGVGRVVRIDATVGSRPASTQKLFTTLPLLLNAPDRRYATTVRAAVEPVNGVVHGNLVVRAVRDPSFTWSSLRDLAQQVHAAGISKVTGKLRLDIGNRSLITRRSGWKWDSVPWDIGPLSPFPVHEDVYRHDSTYLAHPTIANLQQFRRVLGKYGVRVVGGSDIIRSSQASVLVATHQSGPMSALIKHTLLVSDNFYAESMLLMEGSSRVHDLIRAANVKDSYFTDGSGLSYSDRESPRGEVRLLEYAAHSAAADQLVASLPVACRSGTLIDRFCNTIGEGKVWAKTGTLRHNRTLAGYTYDAKGRRVTFAILTWGVQNLTYAQRAIDRAVLVLRRYNG